MDIFVALFFYIIIIIIPTSTNIKIKLYYSKIIRSSAENLFGEKEMSEQIASFHKEDGQVVCSLAIGFWNALSSIFFIL